MAFLKRRHKVATTLERMAIDFELWYPLLLSFSDLNHLFRSLWLADTRTKRTGFLIIWYMRLLSRKNPWNKWSRTGIRNIWCAGKELPSELHLRNLSSMAHMWTFVLYALINLICRMNANLTSNAYYMRLMTSSCSSRGMFSIVEAYTFNFKVNFWVLCSKSALTPSRTVSHPSWNWHLHPCNELGRKPGKFVDRPKKSYWGPSDKGNPERESADRQGCQIEYQGML